MKKNPWNGIITTLIKMVPYIDMDYFMFSPFKAHKFISIHHTLFISIWLVHSQDNKRIIRKPSGKAK
jgi:hypothetical protein